MYIQCVMSSLGCCLAIEPKMEGYMITQQLRKVGNSYVVTVPKEEVERRGWQEGQLLALQLTALEVRPVLRPELQEIVDELLDEHEDALRYLARR